jgi:hypothetical protein
MATPELARQFSEGVEHEATGTAFKPLDKLTNGNLRWYRYQQVNMVGRNLIAHNLNVQCCAGLSDKFSQMFSNLATQDRFFDIG